MSKLFFVLALLSSFLIAQERYDLFTVGSLGTDLSVRSIALGSSLSSSSDAAFTADHNPAGIASLNNPQMSFSMRDNSFLEDFDVLLYSAGFVLPTKIGNFSFIYKRFQTDNIFISTEESPNGVENKLVDQTFILSYAKEILPGLAAGVNLKSFRNSEIKSSETFNKEFNTPIVMDAGIQYSFEGPVGSANLSDKVFAAAVIQNYGSDYEYSYKSKNYYIPTPRYLKLGVSYLLNLKNEDTNLISLLFSGEYKNFLNTLRERGVFWGFGIESKVLDIVSLRIGGIYYPNATLFAKERSVGLSYGFGLNVPFNIFGMDYPIGLYFDYANIRLTEETDYHKNSLDAFNIGLAYGL